MQTRLVVLCVNIYKTTKNTDSHHGMFKVSYVRTWGVKRGRMFAQKGLDIASLQYVLYKGALWTDTSVPRGNPDFFPLI